MFPKLVARNMRRVKELIAVFQMLVAPIGLDEMAHEGPFGMPKNQPRADGLGEGEEVQLLAETAMVALFGLLEHRKMLAKRLAVGKSGAVDPLKHLILFVPAPISAGDPRELEGLDSTGVLDVTSSAKVDEVPMTADADGFSLGDGVEELELVALFGRGEHRSRRFSIDVLHLKGELGSHDLGHLGLDLDEVLIREGFRNIEVVVEAVFDGGADGDLGFRKEPLYGVGHHMGGAMPQSL